MAILANDLAEKDSENRLDMKQEMERNNNNIWFELFYKYFGLVVDKLVPEQYVWAACGITIH